MRIINSNDTAEANKQAGSYPIQLVHIDVGTYTDDDGVEQDGSLFLTTCYRNVSHEDNVYFASASLLELSVIEETQDVKTNAISIRLNAVPNTIIGVLNQVDAIGGRVTIYQAFFDTETNKVVGLIYNKWEGVINSHNVDEDNTEGTVNIEIECKNIINTILNTKAGRFTSDTSISSYKHVQPDNTIITGDRSAEFVSSLVDFNPFFGRED